MKRAIFPGSFSPIHEGHIDIIKRASQLFDKLYVAVSINVDKDNGPNLNERYKNVKKKIKSLNLKNVTVICNRILTIKCAKKYKCKYIVRSLRNTNDFSYELNIAQTHHSLEKNIETVLLFANSKLSKTSSTNIRAVEDKLNKINKSIKK